MKRGRLSFLILVLAGCGLAAPAWAYIDPSAGSYLLQILAAGFFGAMFGLKLFWSRIKGFFSRRSAETARPAREGSASDAGDTDSTSG
jgi:hypothetical protein